MIRGRADGTFHRGRGSLTAAFCCRAVRFNFMDVAHDIDSIPVWTFGDDLYTEMTNAMQHKNGVFHGLLQHVPWGRFDVLVEEHGGDRGTRTLSMRTQFTALAYGQLSQAASLREIESALQSHEARLHHLNARPVKRSTLADANASRPAAVFAGLFAQLLAQAHRRLRRALDETVYLIDSTSVRLSGLSADWAHFSTKLCGAKAHFVLDADGGLPVYMAITPARVNDITAAKAMPIEAGATYVFDLGYYDQVWWAGLDEAGCRIVTRRNPTRRCARSTPQPPPRLRPACHRRWPFLRRRPEGTRALRRCSRVIRTGRPGPAAMPRRTAAIAGRWLQSMITASPLSIFARRGGSSHG